MRTGCPHIDQAVRFALLTANQLYATVERTAKNQNKVIWMAEPLSIHGLKAEIDKECKSLRYWESNGGPHDGPTNGYTCDVCHVVLAFPNIKTPIPKKIDF